MTGDGCVVGRSVTGHSTEGSTVRWAGDAPAGGVPWASALVRPCRVVVPRLAVVTRRLEVGDGVGLAG